MKHLLMRLGAVAAFCSIALLCSNCYTQSFLIGGGAKGAQEETVQNWFVVYGLANVSNTNISALAKGSNSYTATFQRTFIDGLIYGILGGLAGPETVIVRR
ncbi:MAG: Bor/Iss family lipoprotein [Candidatus Kapaibacteriota bacterium]